MKHQREKPPSSKHPPVAIDFYRLEDRILLSGDGVDGDFEALSPEVEADVALITKIFQLDGNSELPDGQAIRVPGPTDARSTNQQPTQESEDKTPSFRSETTDRDALSDSSALEIIFIDQNVQDADQLIQELRSNQADSTEWLVVHIEGDSDGIDQISEALQALNGVDAIHILSHGDGEGIQLGNTRLDDASVTGYAGAIASWADALDPDADLLVYGCELASTQVGQTLMESIGALCDCDVAASDDLTGHVSLGGDWDLEYAYGSIETESLAATNWQGLLATASLSYQGPGSYDVSTAVYAGIGEEFSTGSEESFPHAMTISSDGNEMFVVGTFDNSIAQYSLSTAWDVSTAVYAGAGEEFYVGGEDFTTTSIAFDLTGTKMFITGDGDDAVVEYNLSTAWDVSTAVYAGAGEEFYIGGEETGANGLAFSSDGNKMFIVGEADDSVVEYSLGAAWDVSTAIYAGAGEEFYIGGEETGPNQIVFNSQGTRMFIVGYDDDSVVEYVLGTAWDVSTAVYSGAGAELSLASQEGNPTDIVFNSDGTKLFAVGWSDDAVVEYTIHPGDFTESGTNDGSVIGSMAIVLSGDTFQDVDGDDLLDIGTEVTINNIPAGLTAVMALSDGDTTATLTFTGNAASHQDANDVSALSFVFQDAAFTGGDASAVNSSGDSGAYDPGVGIDFNDNPFTHLSYLSSGSYAVSTAVYAGLGEEFSVAGEDSASRGLAFSTDGSKMFVLGDNDDAVVEYNLGTAWDVSTAVHAGVGEELSIGGQDVGPGDLAFSSDGTKLFVIGDGDDRVVEYDLSTAWDVSTAVYAGAGEEFYVGGQETSNTGLAFSSDGTKMFILGFNDDAVVEYSLSTGWDVSTAVYAGVGEEFYIGSEESFPAGMAFSFDGTQMFILGHTDDRVVKYDLGTAWDVSTAVYAGASEEFYVGGQEGTAQGIAFNLDGTKMFVVGDSGDDVVEYSIDPGDFTEAGANDGSVTGSLTIVLTGDTFQDIDGDDLLDLGSEVTINNIPVGLTAVMALSDGDTVATLTFTGNAGAHSDSADLTDLQFQFADSAFTTYTAAQIINATGPASSNIGIDYFGTAAPVQATIEGANLSYTENDGSVAITSTLAITDADDINIESAVIQIASNYTNGEDVLAFIDASPISGSWNAGTGTMTLTGSDTLANYQAALRNVTYENTSDNPSALTRTVSFKVNDGDVYSNTLTRDIDLTVVNDAPVESTIEGANLAYTENDGAVAITNTLAIADVDDTNIESAVIQITGNYANGEDVLAFIDAGSISGSWNAGTGTMTLTGSDTLSNYQAALRNVTFENTSDNPSGLTRTVSFKVNDGDVDSNTLTRDIDLTAVNDAPVESTIEGANLAYTENDGAVSITSTLAIADADDINIESAVIQITSNYANGEDVLAFIDAGSISGSWNAGTGTMTLTGSDTLANYQAALRNVTYENTSDNPSVLTRTVSFKVNDGDVDSNTLTRDIDLTAVNDAPVESTIEGANLAYTENDGAVAITSTLAIADADDINIESAVIQITGNYANGEDVLAFIDAGSISGSWNAGTGTMTLTGSDTLSNYQAALRNVTYENTSDDPSTATRTISFTVNDGDVNSNTLTRDIDLTAVNDAPVESTIEGANLAYTENDGAVAITNTLAIADVDDTNIESAVIQITGNYANGEDVLAFTDASPISGSWNAGTGTMTLTGSDTLSNYQAALRNVTFENTSDNPSGLTRTVSFKVNDGDVDSNTLTRDIDLTVVNDAPVESTIEGANLAYTENDGAVAITNTLAIADVDDTNIESAVIQITSNYANGEDVLAFIDAGSISGSWNAGTGTMTLTGSDTLANYQAALRNVTFENTSDNPSGLTRTVSFKVNDGDVDSNTLTRDIDLTVVNDAPVESTIEGANLAYTENDGAVAITNTLAIADVDDTNIESAVIQITSNYANGEDVLAFIDAGSISGSWNAGTGTMTLTGSDTLSNYQAALRNVTFENTSDNPSGLTRTVSFKVNDGDVDSNTLTRDIDLTAVNDAPVESTIEGANLAYTENDGAVAITNTLAIADVDDTNIESAVIQITGNYANGEDVLAFIDAGPISGSWNAGTGTMTLTGSDTLTNYEAALRSVTYTNTSNNPSPLTRTVSFKVNDGDVDSNTLTRDIDLTAVNDAPVANPNTYTLVEDTTVNTLNPYFKEKNIVDFTADGILDVDAIDVDGDGDIDVVSASYEDDTVAWYENDGSENFTKHVITNTADAAYSVYVTDVDGDGDIDVLSASAGDDTVAWYENDGSENFTKHVIINTADVAYSVYATDVDGDGDIDVLSASAGDDTVAWYENDGSENFTKHVITNTADAAYSVYATDVDGDGDLDVLSASSADDTVAWYENDGSENFTKHVITNTANNAKSVYASDIDGDGDVDVLSASAGDDTVAWYENDGSENFTKHVITNTADGSHDAYAIDVDGDGDIDVLSASYDDDTVAWYENDGAENFTQHVINNTLDGLHSVHAADIDGDGDNDVLSASYFDDTLAWHELITNLLVNDDDAESDPLTATLVTGPSQAASFTLNADGSFDYTPTANFVGVDTFTYKANDGTIDSNVTTVSLTVTAVNDAPVQSTIEGANLAYTENDGAVAITSTLAITDVDDINIESAVIQITGNYANGEDVLAFTDAGPISGSWNAGTGTITLTGSDTLANYQAALRSVTYENTSDDPSGLTRTVSFKVNDGDVDSNTLTRDIDLTAINDAPVESTIEGANLAYTENDGAVAITSTLAIADADDTNIESAVIQITGNYANGEDVLAYTDAGPISGSWNASTGTMTLTGSDTLANYQAALRSVTYENTSDDPSGLTRTVSFKINDGDVDSNTLTRDIDLTAVNDAPVESTIEGANLAYTENDGAVAITSTLAIADVDDTNIESAVIQITSNYANGEDVLAFTDAGPISGSWNAGTGTMTLTGSDTLVNYQTALRSVTYESTSDNPSALTRTVSFKVNDGDVDSNTLTRDIDLTVVNDAPVESTIEGANLAYTENDGAVAITSTLALADVDDTNIESAVIQITGNYANGEDVLAFTDAGPISGSWNAGTGTMTLTGSDTLANYEAALRSVTYENTSNDPSAATRTVSFTVNDGDVNSNTLTRDIDIVPVNDAPVVRTNTGLLVSEGDLGNVITNAMLDESDPDDDGSELNYSLTNNLANGDLRLNGTVLNTGDTFTQDDLDAGRITYDHDDSETTSDSFAFSLVDGGEDGALPATGTFTITITPVNDHAATAIIDNDPATTSVNENASIGTTVGLTAFSADQDAGDTISYSLDDNDAGRFSIDPNSGVVRVAGSIDREADGATRSLTVRATSSDGSFETQSFVITVNDLNESSVSAITDTDPSSNTVAENAANGTIVGFTASAFDLDSTNNTVTYSLDDNAASRFAIHATSGIVTVLDGSRLDHESNPFHDLVVRANSTDGSQQTSTVRITLSNVNESPSLAINTGVSLSEGTEVTLDNSLLSATDPDDSGSGLLYTVTSSVSEGRLELSTARGFAISSFTQADLDAGRVVYVHTGNVATGNVVNDSFGFSVADGGEAGSIPFAGTFHLTIGSSNDPPVALGESYSVFASETLTVSAPGLLANDSDVNGDSLVSILVVSPSNGTATLDGDGRLTYTPTGGFVGTDQLSYQVYDGSDFSNTVQVSIQVVGQTIVLPSPSPIPEPLPDPVAEESVEAEPEEETETSESEDLLELTEETDLQEETETPTDSDALPTSVSSESIDVLVEETSPSLSSNPVVVVGGFSEGGPSESPPQGEYRHSGDEFDTDGVEELNGLEGFTSRSGASFASWTSALSHQPIDQLLRHNVSHATQWSVLPDGSDRQILSYEMDYQSVTVGVASVGTGVASVGYVLWTARSGVLAASLLGHLPVLQLVDPASLLAAHRNQKRGDQDVLENLF